MIGWIGSSFWETQILPNGYLESKLKLGTSKL